MPLAQQGCAALVVGGPTTVLDLGGLRIVSDPTFDAPGPQGYLTKTQGPAVTEEQIGAVDVVACRPRKESDDPPPDAGAVGEDRGKRRKRCVVDEAALGQLQSGMQRGNRIGHLDEATRRAAPGRATIDRFGRVPGCVRIVRCLGFDLCVLRGC